MVLTQRILPYTKQLVLLALYDVLDQEKSEYRRDTDGNILAGVTVYENYSEFSFTVSEDRATLGSGLSAGTGLAKGDMPPQGIGIALWKTKAINPFRTF